MTQHKTKGDLQMIVKVKKLFDLEKVLKKYGHLKTGKLPWMFARNSTIISSIIEDVRRLTQPTPAIREFEDARIKLGREHAERDAKGKPMQRINPETGRPQFVIMDMVAYDIELKRILEEEFPQAKLDQAEIERKGEELLEEEVDVTFYKLPLYKVPGYRGDDDEENGVLEARDLTIFFELGIITDEEKPYEEPAVASLAAVAEQEPKENADMPASKSA